jgi:DNA-binding winged helix-turn-helix (wHTH) protein/Tol biopolymer transport system component
MSLQAKEIYAFGPYRLDIDGAILSRGEEAVLLPPKVFELLVVLVARRGDIATKDELLTAVWPDTFIEESNLTQNIFTLRRRLGKTEAGEEYIQTVPRRGYRLNVPVTQTDVTSRTLSINSTPPESVRPLGSPVAPVIESAAPTTGKRIVSPLWLVLTLIALAAVTTVVYFKIQADPLATAHYVELTRDGMDKRGSAYARAAPTAALATDGSRVYFTEGSAGANRLAEVAVSGGETVTIPVPFAMTQLLDYSSTLSQLLVGGSTGERSSQRLWAVSVPGGASHPIGDIEASDAGWSPSGTEVVFTKGTALYKSAADGSQVAKIATVSGIPYRPRWSPDARTIRFTMLDPLTKEPSLWEVATDGSNPHPLLSTWNQSSAQCCGEWSKDGKQFVFQATRQGKTEIWVLPPTNILKHLLGLDAPRQVMTAPQDLLTPILSPDGSSVYVLGRLLRGELIRYDPATQTFLPYLGGKSFDFLEFSRDGAWITYVSFPEGTLWRSRPDGSERLQLTFAPMRVMLPHWSPNGREIVFHGFANGTDSDYTISATGGTPNPVFPEEVMTLDWTPDGASFLYSDFPFFTTKPEDTGIYLSNIKSRQVTTITDSRGLVSPVSSPDGRYIIASKANGDGRTLIFDTRTQSWSDLVKSRGIPRWSHDSKWVFYLPANGIQSIMKVRVADRHIEVVSDLAQIRVTGDLSGVQFSLSPEDLPILLRDTGTQEIYSVSLNSR